MTTAMRRILWAGINERAFAWDDVALVVDPLAAAVAADEYVAELFEDAETAELAPPDEDDWTMFRDAWLTGAAAISWELALAAAGVDGFTIEFDRGAL